MGFEGVLIVTMMNRKYLIGMILGFMIGVSFVGIEAAIPPTPALKSIDVQTTPWFGSSTDVNATLFNDQFFFVSDGSITFNVTETPP